MSHIKSLLLLCAILLAGCQDYQNQDSWGGLCQTGQNQSPVNLRLKAQQGTHCRANQTFKINNKMLIYTQKAYDPTNLNLKNPYPCITINYGKNGQVKEFKSQYFTLHHPSEHQIDGRSFDLELQIYTQAADKTVAIYSIFFVVHNGWYADPIYNFNFSTTVDKRQRFPFEIWGPPKNLYHYVGSETVPDCNEGVHWFLAADPHEIMPRSFNDVVKLINGGKNNNRKLQPFAFNKKIDQYGTVCNGNKHFGLTRNHLLSHQE